MFAMRLRHAVLALVVGCHADHAVAPDAAGDAAVDAAPDAPLDRWQAIFDEVDPVRLKQLVTDLAHERYSDAGRARFRTYWTQYMTALGLPVRAFDFQATVRPGTNLEAVLAGP